MKPSTGYRILPPPEFREREKAVLSELEWTGRPVRYEKEYIRRDGSRVPVELVINLKEGPDGQEPYYYGFITDITERKRAIRALEESEAMFRDLLESLPSIAVQGYRPDGTVNYWNRANEAVYGYTAEEAIGKNLVDLIIPPDMRDFIREAIRHGAETGGMPPASELNLMRKDGSLVPVFSSHAIVRIPGREPEMFCVDVNLTGLKETEQALRESEEKFRTLVEHALEGILILDLQGKILFANRSAANLIDMEDSRLATGRNVLEFIAPESKEDVIRDFGQVAAGIDAYIARYRIATLKGRDVWVESIGKNIMYEGAPADLVSIRDITERKRAEDALRQANRQLTLLGSITRHDILNKISIILGFLALSKKKCKDAEISTYLAKLETATQAIRSQIDFTRLYQDLGSHEPRWQNLEDTIRSLQVPSRILLEEKGYRGEIYADPMLRKVFENFLDNTIRHGKTATRIRVSARETPEGLALTWEDNGVGIPTGEKEQIFARGYGSNTGLGLFLVREILTITGITIRETGEPGKGARFEILVPKEGYRLTELSG